MRRFRRSCTHGPPTRGRHASSASTAAAPARNRSRRSPNHNECASSHTSAHLVARSLPAPLKLALTLGIGKRAQGAHTHERFKIHQLVRTRLGPSVVVAVRFVLGLGLRSITGPRARSRAPRTDNGCAQRRRHRSTATRTSPDKCCRRRSRCWSPESRARSQRGRRSRRQQRRHPVAPLRGRSSTRANTSNRRARRPRSRPPRQARNQRA